MIADAHAAFEESISLADRIGDEDRVLVAAVAFGAPQLWGSRDWGESDPSLVMLLERQLDRIGNSDPARRVRILATLATELYFDEAAQRGWGYANQALDAARQLGQPEELGIAVCAYLLLALVTDHLPELRAVVDDMLASHWAELTPRVQAILRATSLTERIRFGDFARFDAEYGQAWRLATDVLHSPELQAQLRFVQACRYFFAGDVERGIATAELGFKGLTGVTGIWREPTRFAMDSCLMLITGTFADNAERLAARLAEPDHPSIPHVVAPAAALGFTQRRHGSGTPDCLPLVRAASAVVDLDPGHHLLDAGRHRARCPRPPVAVRPARTPRRRACHRRRRARLRWRCRQLAGRAGLASRPPR
jgi:hypothetical protein